MNHNVGSLDRALRITAGLILLSLVFVGPRTPWGWIGLLPLATGIIRWCPAYLPLGIRTCPKEGVGGFTPRLAPLRGLGSGLYFMLQRGAAESGVGPGVK
ncbi:MAG: hypothetical protein COZ33_12645 [Nitrospirae bacterium CG_4_10_14_3_um_filter_70_108]|nr:MAG: hypothetical protein COZ33_12645 [Nitrospirae bacterium CG_4_10_14_3_um_filter_70_108]